MLTVDFAAGNDLAQSSAPRNEGIRFDDSCVRCLEA
jgi:hypothetical protein